MRQTTTLILLSAVLVCGMVLWRNRVADEMPNRVDVEPLGGKRDDSREPVTPQTRKLLPQIVEPETVGYVGSSKCTECHQEIAEKFQSHPMAQSVSTVPGMRPIEDYVQNTSFSPDEIREYGVETVDGVIQHYEQFRDAEGMVVYHQTEPIEFAVGSGQRGRSYLLNRDGVLFMSPVTWYSEGARWDLSPGYNPQEHPRFERRVADGCIACHAGAVRQDLSGPDRFAAEPFFEMSIGCERCHGPGKEHIDLQYQPDKSEEPDSIVNPAKLNPARRDSVCYQCHLHGVNRIPRTGCSEFSFRPGSLLSDHWAVFVSGNPSRHDGAPARAVSQVEQMHESACFKKSAGELGCISCHDPHSIPSEAERIDFYRGRCLVCHEENDRCSLEIEARLQVSPEDSCILCHMPKLPASDVPHTSQTDHRVLRRPLEITESRGGSGRPPVPFAPELFPVSAVEIARAEGIIFSNLSEPMASQLAEEAFWRFQQIVELDHHDTALVNAIGRTEVRLGRLSVGKRSLEEAFSNAPGHESAIDSLAAVNERIGDLEMALAWAQRFVEVNPSSYGHSRLALLLMQLDDVERAILEAEAALRLNPLMHATRSTLIAFLVKHGRNDAAVAHQKVLGRLKRGASEGAP